MAGDYSDGLKEGIWQFWHDNGRISGQGAFQKDKPAGVWTTWHDNGQRESEGMYIEGLQQGPFTYWDRHGHISRVVHYDRGQMVANP
jgi:antitoxin component YwqK of YwqJK toxin-antitoxin module